MSTGWPTLYPSRRNVKRQHDRSMVFMQRLVKGHPIRVDAMEQGMEESLGGRVSGVWAGAVGKMAAMSEYMFYE